MDVAFASVIGEAWDSFGERRFLFLALAGFVCGFVLIAAAKYRLVHALFGIFIPGLPLYAALRLAKPGSIWAKRFYGERRPAKQARAEQRFHPGRLTDRWKERLRDAIGGVTEEEYEARLAATAGPTPKGSAE